MKNYILKVFQRKFFYGSQLYYHHGHDNALNNKTILYILKRLAERWAESDLGANLPWIIPDNNQDDD